MKTLLLSLLLIVPALRAQAAGAKMAPEERARLEAVRDRLSDAVRAKPEDASVWRKLGQVHQALGAAEPARDAFLQVTRLDPSDAGAWSLLALAHEKLEEVPQAVAAWEACAARAKDPELAAVARKHLQVLRP